MRILALWGALVALLANVIPYTGPTQPMPTCDPATQAAMSARFHGGITCSNEVPRGALPFAPTVIVMPTPTATPTR